MRAITVIEDGADRMRSLYVRDDGDVTVFDKDRSFRFRADVAGAVTIWQLLARVTPAVAAAEQRSIKIESLADRCRTGWVPVAAAIDEDIPQHVLHGSHFGVDLLRYPDDPELEQFARATILLGRDGTGRALVTGEILWIDADRRWAVCQDGLWWLPADDETNED